MAPQEEANQPSTTSPVLGLTSGFHVAPGAIVYTSGSDAAEVLKSSGPKEERLVGREGGAGLVLDFPDAALLARLVSLDGLDANQLAGQRRGILRGVLVAEGNRRHEDELVAAERRPGVDRLRYDLLIRIRTRIRIIGSRWRCRVFAISA